MTWYTSASRHEQNLGSQVGPGPASIEGFSPIYGRRGNDKRVWAILPYAEKDLRIRRRS